MSSTGTRLLGGVYQLVDVNGDEINDPPLLKRWVRKLNRERRRLQQAIVATFPSEHPDCDAGPIRDFFHRHGFSLPPLVVVPRTAAHARAMRRILETAQAPLPFESEAFADPQYKMAASFYSGYLDLAVVFDRDLFLTAELYGEETVRTNAQGTAIHEYGHGACAEHLAKFQVVLAPDGSLAGVTQNAWLTGRVSFRFEAGRLVHEYVPSWLDEATASYFQGWYRREVEQLTGPGHDFKDEDRPLHIPEPYLLRSSECPEYPGCMYGGILAADLDRLGTAIPELLPLLFDVCQGHRPLGHLHALLQDRLPPEAAAIVLGQAEGDDWPELSFQLQDLMERRPA